MAWRVLVADDERAICVALSAVLESHGFEVVTAPSAKSAKQALRESAFDLVISDMQMETKTSGYDVVEMAAKRVPRPAIILVTAYPDLLSNWREHGAHAMMEKPFPVTRLLETMNHLLRGGDAAAHG